MDTELPWLDKSSNNSRINQHSFYDVDFNDDPSDVLYRFLNNINPEILEHEQNAVSNTATQEFVYIDPRTNSDCLHEVIDHSKAGRSAKTFDKYPKKSCMGAAQHKVTLKYLQNNEKGGNFMNKNDLTSYHRSEAKRSMERTTFHEFMKEYCLVYFQEIYGTLEEYVNLYRKEFDHLSKEVLSKEDELFSIISGLPIPQNICAYEAEVKDIKITRREGLTRKYCETNDYHLVAGQKAKYFALSQEKQFEDLLEGTIVMHDEALVFLLAADFDNESPSELIFEVKDNQTVVFYKPFPSRSVSLRTPRAIFKNIVDTYDAVPGKCELLSMHMDAIEPQTSHIEEIFSNTESISIQYKLEPVDKFLEPVSSELTSKLSNRVDINFTLKDIQITLQRSVPFCFNEGNQTLLNFSPKLEFKSSFGCEVMSKFELLSEWVDQKFLPNSLTCRQRLDVRTFQNLHSAMLSVTDIEEELEFRYKIKTSILLGSLYHLLEIICRMPPGKYLLRHSEKSHDKFLAYKKTEGVDPESKGVISLHNIFKEEISNLEFFKQKKYVGIDHKVCSTVHLTSNIAPCAFPFWIQYGTTRPMKNDRTAILKLEKKKADAKEARIKASRKKKKSRKSKERRAKRQEENQEQLEVQRDILNDIKLGIC